MGSLHGEIGRIALGISPPPEKPAQKERPRKPLGIERAPGETIIHQGLNWAESVRQREAACAAARRTAEWQQREARVAAVQQRRAAAEAEAIAEAASAEAARQLYKDQWAERAQAAVAREIHKEGASTRAAWRVTETKVISGRKLALGGLTSLTRKDEAEAKASMGK